MHSLDDEYVIFRNLIGIREDVPAEVKVARDVALVRLGLARLVPRLRVIRDVGLLMLVQNHHACLDAPNSPWDEFLRCSTWPGAGTQTGP